MRILVTGASGQIGSYLLEEFARKHEVLGVDLKPYPNEEFRDHVVLGDLRSFEFAKEILKEVDVVIHSAAQVSVENSWVDPVYDAENNVLAIFEGLVEDKMKEFLLFLCLKD